jgi:hypothetical protein
MAWAGILFLLLGFAHLNRKDNQTYCSGNMLKINNLHSDHNISVNIELIIQLNSNYILKHETEKKTFPLLFIMKAAQNCSAHNLFLKCSAPHAQVAYRAWAKIIFFYLGRVSWSIHPWPSHLIERPSVDPGRTKPGNALFVNPSSPFLSSPLPFSYALHRKGVMGGGR